MSDTGKFCCFNCPDNGQELKRLSDRCPDCGREYGFPLTSTPTSIGDFDVERPLGRGFYAATFVARPRTGLNRALRVLKVAPVAMYEKFDKDFAAESARHSEVADGADHVVAVDDIFDADIDFAGLVLRCHVAVLQFVDGDTLAKYLSGARPLTAPEAAQIACDLFRMKEEFERLLVNHNDLHAGNIIVEELPPGRRRADAIEPAIRAVAIDLGSVAGDRRSGGGYTGDLHWIGHHILAMADRLLSGGDTAPDLDKRIGLKLHGIAQGLATATENQRTPVASDMITGIREQYHRTAEAWRPWRNQTVLRTFDQSYNAQTLDAWYVPQLIVDPDGAWLRKVSSPGPLVMTGMRGCGKTMLLHSLQFHARAAVLPKEEDAAALKRVKEDGYVGLFVSAQRLIPVDPRADRPSTEELFARLLVAYAAQAARAMAHLEDLAKDAIAFDAGVGLLHAVCESLAPRPELEQPSTIEHLERCLSDLLIRVSRSDSGLRLATNPNTAFPLLADAIRKAAPIWHDAQILFLLDDVSTRYLDADRIEELLSALLFQHSHCAFKLTSEAQTIFLSLKSPGQVHPAAAGRDFTTFDLGAEVQTRLKDRSGKTFVTEILDARARLFPGHPGQSSANVLGDKDLESIARAIAETRTRSRERKRLYHGLRALAGVCVGDIGAVIQIYQEILTGSGITLPVQPERQHEVFQDFCARHLYSLDRRGSDLKLVALQFAEASHQLLMESGREKPTGRIRQYTSLYVRVTAGELQEQMTRLRELVDAGVFVFTGGTARTKTHDSDPVQQFKLTFRKIYGLANFIGLSDRDRFELSGEDLQRWLKEPTAGREILLRNLSTAAPESEDEPSSDDIAERPIEHAQRATPESQATQMDLLAQLDSSSGPSDQDSLPMVFPPAPAVHEVASEDLAKTTVDDLIIGLGFEDRTPESLMRTLTWLRPRRVIAIRYDNPGHGDDMRKAITDRGISLEEVAYPDFSDGSGPALEGRTMVDITGLAKPALFTAVRAGLRAERDLIIAYTGADEYYPLEEDLRKVLEAYGASDPHQLLTALRGVLTGERGPYQLLPLLAAETDGTRLRALSAFASPRHERLLHLAAAREYDAVQIITDIAETSRARVGGIAARVALEDTPGGVIASADAGNLGELVNSLARQHERWFIRSGLDFEIGLTGNKMQAAAAAIVAAALPVSQVWYVKPETFDQPRFTRGVTRSRYFSVASGRADHRNQ
ncbi:MULTISPECIES: hypothetical protein [unclassified Novosphingobium]|uniref:ORC-CDC6 family AAA ATPase n=1 Tax=unclassified Novosphingobium TaxID=2644732 RepID=UPI0025CF9A83|nr:MULTISPECIES: hypothetical protein [unclassified Novosphingobium]HQV04696.1 hypothetical protein [Novosphingobium sp.]